MIKNFTINCTMKDRWIDEFCSFLKYMEHNGSIGHSSLVGFYADGDGDFRPKFDINIEYNTKEGYKTDWKPETMFDAG